MDTLLGVERHTHKLSIHRLGWNIDAASVSGVAASGLPSLHVRDGPIAVTSRLYYEDNLEVMRSRIPNGSVDMIYLDPPFNSNTDYNMFFGRGVWDSAQVKAFDDTWSWDGSAADTKTDLLASRISL